jgi:hypothetical protein
VEADARAGLENVHHEMGVQEALHHFPCGLYDGVGAARVEQAQLQVGQGRGYLDHAVGPDQRGVSAQPADGVVLDRARRLGPVVGPRGHAHFAQRVGFLAKLDSHARSIPQLDGLALRSRARSLP